MRFRPAETAGNNDLYVARNKKHVVLAVQDYERMLSIRRLMASNKLLYDSAAPLFLERQWRAVGHAVGGPCACRVQVMTQNIQLILRLLIAAGIIQGLEDVHFTRRLRLAA